MHKGQGAFSFPALPGGVHRTETPKPSIKKTGKKPEVTRPAETHRPKPSEHKPVFTVTKDPSAHAMRPTVLINKIDLAQGREKAMGELRLILTSAKTRGYKRIECHTEEQDEIALLKNLGFTHYRERSRTGDDNVEYYYLDIR